MAKTEVVRPNLRAIRKHLLLEPCLALLAAFVGWSVAEVVQVWGMNHLGWFEPSCDLPGGGIASCVAIGPTDAWPLGASGFALVVWVLMRRRSSRPE